MKNKKNAVIAIASCALLGAMAVGGTMAYLTDSEKQVNEFTFGTVQVDLVEATFSDTAKTDIDASTNVAKYKTALVPYATAPKDPKIVNTGTESAVVFLKVEVPNFSIAKVSEAGAASAEARADIYELQFTGGTALTLTENALTGAGKNWYLISKTGAEDSTNKTTYVFAYKTGVAADDETDTLFDQIQFVNMTDGSYKTVTVDNVDTAKDINVYAYGIQLTGLNNITAVDDDLTDAFTAAELSAIWTAYGTQNASETENQANTHGGMDLSGADID